VRRLLFALVLSSSAIPLGFGCLYDFTLGPPRSELDGSSPSGSETGVTTDAAPSCSDRVQTVAQNRARAIVCNLDDSKSCQQGTTDECGCLFAVTSADAAPTVAYDLSVAALKAAGCAPQCAAACRATSISEYTCFFTDAGGPPTTTLGACKHFSEFGN
jgi:hypothetical protein